MTTALTTWDPNSGAALPAYLTEGLEELGTNINDRMTVPSLSYEGKTWTIVRGSDKQKLQAPNSDGDMVPIPIMRAVILNYNPDRGRAYYPGTYNPSQTAQPDCWSRDGKEPDPSSKKRQASACNGCPQSVKGSKVQDGKEMVACGSHRMIALAPAFDILADPLRLKIAVTSDYDKEVVEHGWMAFRQYTDWLKSRGITHTAMAVTKIKFDANVAYPKLLFSLDRPVTQEEFAQVKQALANPKVAELLAENWSPAGVAGTPTDDADIKPFGLEGAYADGWQAHPDSAGWSWKGQEVIQNDELAARYPAPVKVEEPAAPPAIPASQQVIDHSPAAPAESVPPSAPAADPVAAQAVEHNPIAAAQADGWIVHPTAPGYHYKGQDVVADGELSQRYPAAPAPVAEAPAAPPPAPAPEPVAAVDPLSVAQADGWIVHPSAPGYHYKGQEVVADADLIARYPAAAGNVATAAAAPTPPTPAPAAVEVSGASPSEAPATPAAANDAAVPADVQALLSKWAG